jgi:hypothetical protein
MCGSRIRVDPPAYLLKCTIDALHAALQLIELSYPPNLAIRNHFDLVAGKYRSDSGADEKTK